jgi:hypothetical protein
MESKQKSAVRRPMSGGDSKSTSAATAGCVHAWLKDVFEVIEESEVAQVIQLCTRPVHTIAALLCVSILTVHGKLLVGL